MMKELKEYLQKEFGNLEDFNIVEPEFALDYTLGVLEFYKNRAEKDVKDSLCNYDALYEVIIALSSYWSDIK